MSVYYYFLKIVGPLLGVVLGLFPKFRGSFQERNGFGVWKAFGSENPAETAWFHGASVGEVNGLEPLLKKFASEFPHLKIVVSTTSETGKERVEQMGYAAALLPFDYPQAVARVLSRIKPAIIVVSETEIWPSLFLEANKRNVPVVLVNSRISDYSWPYYKLLKYFLRQILSGVSFVAAQSKVDADRYLELGVAEQKVSVGGSTKYDRSQGVDKSDVKKLTSLKKEYGFDTKSKIFVAGSVRPGEDEIVVRAFIRAREELPELGLLIAPRHPEKFNDVADILSKNELSFIRRSMTGSSVAESSTDVLLLDKMGELNAAYSVGDLAFVGATLVDIGGHNPLEPAAASLPILIGPHYSNIKREVSLLQDSGALVIVENERELASQIVQQLGDPKTLQASSEAAFKTWQGTRGATNRVMLLLNAQLKQSANADYGLSESKLIVLLAFAAAGVFSVVTSIRNKLFDWSFLRTSKAAIPVVSIGNVTVGGSGKTPVAEFFAALLIEQGKKPVILSRGYKGSLRGPHHVSKDDEVDHVGDEALMQCRKLAPEVEIVVAKDRVKGAQFIEENKLGDVIILDDGFQHRWLSRDLNVLLVDPSEENFISKWSRPTLLPLGRFREKPKKAFERADLVVFVVRKWATNEEKLKEAVGFVREQFNLNSIAFLQLKGDEAIKIDGSEEKSLQEFKDVSLLSALARPKQFLQLVEASKVQVNGYEFFPDHFSWSYEEWVSTYKRLQPPVLVTEKDATKLCRFRLINHEDVWVVPLRVNILGSETKNILLRLLLEKEIVTPLAES